jgi:hypothetical protein
MRALGIRFMQLRRTSGTSIRASAICSPMPLPARLFLQHSFVRRRVPVDGAGPQARRCGHPVLIHFLLELSPHFWPPAEWKPSCRIAVQTGCAEAETGFAWSSGLMACGPRQ